MFFVFVDESLYVKMSLRGHQGPPKLERLESVMSKVSGSLDQDDLQDDPEELDLSGHTDLCGGNLHSTVSSLSSVTSQDS